MAVYPRNPFLEGKRFHLHFREIEKIELDHSDTAKALGSLDMSISLWLALAISGHFTVLCHFTVLGNFRSLFCSRNCHFKSLSGSRSCHRSTLALFRTFTAAAAVACFLPFGALHRSSLTHLFEVALVLASITHLIKSWAGLLPNFALWVLANAQFMTWNAIFSGECTARYLTSDRWWWCHPE